jgi:hypothetical protein
MPNAVARRYWANVETTPSATAIHPKPTQSD